MLNTRVHFRRIYFVEYKAFGIEIVPFFFLPYIFFENCLLPLHAQRILYNFETELYSFVDRMYLYSLYYQFAGGKILLNPIRKEILCLQKSFYIKKIFLNLYFAMFSTALKSVLHVRNVEHRKANMSFSFQ